MIHFDLPFSCVIDTPKEYIRVRRRRWSKTKKRFEYLIHMSFTNSAAETYGRATLKRKQRSFEFDNDNDDGGFQLYTRRPGMFRLYLDAHNEA